MTAQSSEDADFGANFCFPASCNQGQIRHTFASVHVNVVNMACAGLCRFETAETLALTHLWCRGVPHHGQQEQPEVVVASPSLLHSPA